MRYLDGARGRWLGGPVLEAGMGTMRQACAEEHQRYLLYSSLMRHVGAPGGCHMPPLSSVLAGMV